MKMYIKESYVYTLPGYYDRESRWVACQGEGCGYERTDKDHTIGGKPMFRMYKVNGVQICEGCLIDWKKNIQEALDK